MRLRFTITIKKGPAIVSVINGFKEVAGDEISVEQMQEVIMLEQSIEKFTGYSAHVEIEYLSVQLVEHSACRG